ncbi:MAG TPA: hypothetical protein DCG47_02175 [Spirochaetaceae bacterium]|nr:hypothetical protein [Spirochaetaceae bacterium]
MGDAPRLALRLMPAFLAALALTYFFPGAFAAWGRLRGIAFAAGIELLGLGFLFQASAAFELVRAWKKGRVATRGAYGLSRNPIFSWWIFSVIPSFALLLDSWLFLPVAILFRLVAGKAAKAEERELHARFGQDYDAYRLRTRAFLPLPRLLPLSLGRSLRGILGLAALACLALGIYLAVAGPAMRGFGARSSETAARMAGDEYAGKGAASYTQGIDIDAPPERVWKWLVQIGYKRAGWYNIDIVNRLADPEYFHDGKASALRIIPEFQNPREGDKIYLVPALGMTIAKAEVPRLLVLVAEPDKLGGNNVAWTFSVEPLPKGRSRLLARFRIRMGDDFGSRAAASFMNDLAGATIQQPAMLWGLKLRAESRLPTITPKDS